MEETKEYRVTEAKEESTKEGILRSTVGGYSLVKWGWTKALGLTEQSCKS